MSQNSTTKAKIDTSALPPSIHFPPLRKSTDIATLSGLGLAFGLIAAAILMGQSNANFFNVPSLMIVVFGTMAATAVSYTGEELAKTWDVIGKSIFQQSLSPSKLATSLVNLAIVAKKKGILSISTYEDELKKNAFASKAMQMVIDGYKPDNISRLLQQEIDLQIERERRSAGITRRASEVAPAMGLIGTLVGLVQMLADLENPETIGPAMAVALLTTFYGAILGTVVMAPLAVKLEKYSNDDVLIKSLVAIAATSISRQDNPRQLEMLLNAQLPPSERITYFD